jgi:hypothetical protein
MAIWVGWADVVVSEVAMLEAIGVNVDENGTKDDGE